MRFVSSSWLRHLCAVLIVIGAVTQVGLWLFVARSQDDGYYTFSEIEPGLFMGGRVDQPPPKSEVVLNLDQLPDDYACPIHVWEPIRDSAPAPDLDWLRKQVEFVDRHRRAKRVTYVHCHAGVSRSAMVVTAYLMASHGWSRDEALAFIRQSRPQVRPNPAFMDRLAEWESKR